MSRKNNQIRVVAYKHPSFPYVKVFGTRKLLAYAWEEYQGRGDLVEHPEDRDNAFSEGLNLARSLFKIDGVQSVVINQYNVEVEISPAFSWKSDGIEAEVVSAIRNYISACDTLSDASDNVGSEPGNNIPLE